jgi:putative RNA 2'-phosphotransferase
MNTSRPCRARDKDHCPTHGLAARDPKLSKRVAYVLRHNPGSIGLTLDPHGWVKMTALQRGLGISRRVLTELVAADEKQRYTIDGDRIRAAQGHSVPVQLQHEQLVPPAVLYHGTVAAALPGIRATGLQRGQRLAVHLSGEVATAETVGARRGAPVILQVDAAGMHAAGYAFHRSENGVWLVSDVPVAYITFPG